MLVGAFSDPHVWSHARFGGIKRFGVNDRARLVLDVLNRATTALVGMGAECIVVAGDLFDGDEPEPALTACVQRLLGANRGLHWVIMPGNHDQTTEELGDHACAPLACLPNVTVIDSPTRWGDCLYLPYRNDDPKTWLATELDKHDGVKVLFLHMGIKDETTDSKLLRSPQSINAYELTDLCRKHGDVRTVFSGHWHGHGAWRDRGIAVVQCGTLCPTGFRDAGDAGLYGNVFTVDTGTGAFGKLPSSIAGPRFSIGTAAQVASEVSGSQSPGNSWYARIKYDPRTTRAEDIAVPEGLAGVEFWPDTAAFNEQSHHAAESAAVAAGLATRYLAADRSAAEAALKAYVATMPLEAGVDRDAVLALALQLYDGN